MMWDNPPPPPQQGGFQHYPEASQAQTVFILGILGIVICGVLGPIAWIMGNTEIGAIEAGRRPPDGLSNAKTGRTLGMIATILMAVGIGIIIVVAITSAASGGYRY